MNVSRIRLLRLFLRFWLLGVILNLVACDQGLVEVTETDTVGKSTASSLTRLSAIPPALTGTPSKSPIPTSKLGLEADDLRGTIIHFWHTWSGPTGDIIQSQVDEFNLNNEWGIVVVPVYQGNLDDVFENVLTSFETGKLPDLTMGYLHQAQAWDATRGLVDLNIYVDDPIWGLSQDEQTDFYPVFWEQDVSEGRRLGVPAWRSGQVLYFNTTWARDLGFGAPPMLPRQFKEQACAAARANEQDAEPENNGTGGWIVSTNYAALLGWIYAFGGDVLAEPEPGKGQTVYQFDTPEIEEAFSFIRGLYDEGCAWLAESQYPDIEFAQRLGLFASGSVMDIPYQLEAFDRLGVDDQWVIIPFPSPTANRAFDVYGPSYVMFPSTPQRQMGSWLFVKWLSNPQNQARIVEASGAFPLRASALSYLEGYKTRHSQWATALELLPLARSEPPFQSWDTVRWALSDAGTQLFRSYFTIDRVPGLVDFLDNTATELHMGLEVIRAFDTPTNTPSPSTTVTISPSPTVTFTPTRTPGVTASATNTSSATINPSPSPSITTTE